MTARTRRGFWQTGQRSGSTCETRRITSRHFLDGSLWGGGGERPGRRGTSSAGEVAEAIRAQGYEPVWKDWDAALTA